MIEECVTKNNIDLSNLTKLIITHHDFDHMGSAADLKLKYSNIQILASLKDEKYIYLTTQSWSYKAVNLYLRFGFKPYSGSRPENWECCHMDFENYNNEAWELIWSKIK